MAMATDGNAGGSQGRNEERMRRERENGDTRALSIPLATLRFLVLSPLREAPGTRV